MVPSTSCFCYLTPRGWEMDGSCSNNSNTLCEDMQKEGCCVCQIHEKNCVFLLSPSQEEDHSEKLGFTGDWDPVFYLPHCCPSSAVLYQCLWVCCPPERTSSNTGVEISLGYDVYMEVRGSWVFWITSCHFKNQYFFTPPSLLSFPCLIFSPHPLLILLSFCYLCGPNFHLVLTECVCVLT